MIYGNIITYNGPQGRMGHASGRLHKCFCAGIPVNTPAISLSWDQDQVGTKNESANLAGPRSQECVGTHSIRAYMDNYTSKTGYIISCISGFWTYLS
jgi:hypothetical protein